MDLIKKKIIWNDEIVEEEIWEEDYSMGRNYNNNYFCCYYYYTNGVEFDFLYYILLLLWRKNFDIAIIYFGISYILFFFLTTDFYNSFN